MTTTEKPGKWKVLESRYLHREPWLTVRKERLEMPNGNIVPDYYVLEYPNWVNIIAITKDDRFVLVQQYRHGIEKTCMELCAGVCDNSDGSIMEAAMRELLEETGYGGGTWSELMCISPNASATNTYSYCFIARDVEEITLQSLESSEDISVHLVDYQELRQLLSDWKIIQATMAAPLWKFITEFEHLYKK